MQGHIRCSAHDLDVSAKHAIIDRERCTHRAVPFKNNAISGLYPCSLAQNNIGINAAFGQYSRARTANGCPVSLYCIRTTAGTTYNEGIASNRLNTTSLHRKRAPV